MHRKPVTVCLIMGAFCAIWAAVGYFHHDQTSMIIWLLAAVISFAAAAVRRKAG